MPEGGAVEIGVEVAAAGDFKAGDAFHGAQAGGDFLGDGARSFLETLGQLEANRGGGFAKLDLGRTLEDDGEREAVLVLDVVREGVSEAVCDGQVHSGSTKSSVASLALAPALPDPWLGE